MSKKKAGTTFSFDRYDKARLQKAILKATDARVNIRLRAVLLVASGKRVSEVAALFGTSRRIVYHWITTYLKYHEPSSLFEAPRSGRPLSAQDITDKRILRELKRNPLKLGYNTTVWTVVLLAEHLNARYGSSIHPRTLYRRMIAMGLRCKRPRYVYSEKDPNRAQKKGQSYAS